MRVDLKVPYEQKDEAKRLGARWDRDRRVWYVPDGIDPAPFAHWRPPESPNHAFNLRGAEAYLVRSPARCWRCTESFTAVGFLMAPGFEIRDHAENGNGIETEFWSTQEEWAFAHYITDMPSAITNMLKSEAPLYRLAFSKTTQTTYWANHCPACKVLQGDFNLFEEPDGAFFLLSAEQARKMTATRLAMTFEADGEPSFGIDDADLIPGVALHQSDQDEIAGTESSRQTFFVKPPIGKSASLPPRSRGGLMGRLKSLLGGRR